MRGFLSGLKFWGNDFEMVPEDEDKDLKLQAFVNNGTSESIQSASRPSYLSAKNYVFFLGRQVTKDRGLEVSESTASENESFIVELPKLCDLLRKLKDDLRCDSEDFLEEFVSEPQNGVIVLLELLKTCHGRQSNQEKNKSVRHQERQHVLKKVLSDEYDSLLCLKYSVQFHKAIVSITEHYSGLSILASCIMSNFTKSRVVALEILGKVCDVCPESYTKILEAMSSVKLIFGESVRFKFLVSMLMGSGKTAQGFEKVTLQFLNTLLYRCPRPAERIRLQCELEEAGLNVDILEKKLEMKNTPLNDEVWKETRKWKDNYLDVQATIKENHTISSLNSNLRQEVALLRNAVASLEGDKIRLMQIESELKDKCEELEHELNIMKKEREELENTKTITKADGSDVVTTDSGRHSFQTEDENDRPENEEILIDVPTIRPPAGFRSPTEEECVSEEEITCQRGDDEPQNLIQGIDPLISNVDLDLNWSYPKIPQVKIIPYTQASRNGELAIRRPTDKNIVFVHEEMILFPNTDNLRNSYHSLEINGDAQHMSSPDRETNQRKTSPCQGYERKVHCSLDYTDMRMRNCRNQKRQIRSDDIRDFQADCQQTRNRLGEDPHYSDNVTEKVIRCKEDNYRINSLYKQQSAILNDFIQLKARLDQYNSNPDKEHDDANSIKLANDSNIIHFEKSDRTILSKSPEEDCRNNPNIIQSEDLFHYRNTDVWSKVPEDVKQWKCPEDSTSKNGPQNKQLEALAEGNSYANNVGLTRRRPNNTEVRYVDSSGFFFKPGTGSLDFPASWEQTETSCAYRKKVIQEEPIKPVTKTFPLPIAYRNNLLVNKHVKSDLYTGVSNKFYDPPERISSLVHQEITKAVKEISGWL